MKAIADQKYTLKEYFELEKNSEEKWEYWDGYVWNMSGASPPHERIVINAGAHLRDLLRGRGCSVFGSNLKIAVPNYPPYRYPDLSVYCGEGDFIRIGGLDVLTNPQLIVEVLSPSTEAFDRGAKFTYYKSIPSLTDYLLISAVEPYITYIRKTSTDEWVHTEATGMDASITLPTFNIELVLSEIYLDIDLPELKLRTPEDDLLDR